MKTVTQVRLCIREIYNVVYFKCTDPAYISSIVQSIQYRITNYLHSAFVLQSAILVVPVARSISRVDSTISRNVVTKVTKVSNLHFLIFHCVNSLENVRVR